MQTNLVPFKNAHFLCTSFAPLTSPANKEYRKFSVLDLAQQMISKDNFCIKVDPLNPGDAREGIEKIIASISFNVPCSNVCRKNEMKTNIPIRKEVGLGISKGKQASAAYSFHDLEGLFFLMTAN